MDLTAQAAYPMEPGLVLFYRAPGQEWHLTVYAPVTVDGKELIPVGNSQGTAGYVALTGGWVWEHGRRDRNGQAFWAAPRRVMPAALEPGLTWECSDHGESYTCTAEAAEEVSVAAGRFPAAYRVRVEQNGVLFAREWHLPGIGLVRAEDAAGNLTAELVRIERGAPAHFR